MVKTKEYTATCDKCKKTVGVSNGEFFDYTGEGNPVFYCKLCLEGKK